MSQFNPYASGYADPTQQPYAASGTVLADRSTRFVSALIDGLIILPIVIPVALVVGFAVAAGLGESAMTQIASSILGGLVGIGAYLAVHGYFLATSGQTIGKKLFKLQIVRENGSLMPFGELVLKRYAIMWVLGMIPYIGGLFNIANALAIFRENRKCIHDEIAGTKVIKIG